MDIAFVPVNTRHEQKQLEEAFEEAFEEYIDLLLKHRRYVMSLIIFSLQSGLLSIPVWLWLNRPIAMAACHISWLIILVIAFRMYHFALTHDALGSMFVPRRPEKFCVAMWFKDYLRPLVLTATALEAAAIIAENEKRKIQITALGGFVVLGRLVMLAVEFKCRSLYKDIVEVLEYMLQIHDDFVNITEIERAMEEARRAPNGGNNHSVNDRDIDGVPRRGWRLGDGPLLSDSAPAPRNQPAPATRADLEKRPPPSYEESV